MPINKNNAMRIEPAKYHTKRCTLINYMYEQPTFFNKERERERVERKRNAWNFPLEKKVYESRPLPTETNRLSPAEREGPPIEAFCQTS